MATRALSILAALVLVLSLVSPAMAEIKAGTTVVVNNPVSSDRLHLRTKPNRTASSLGKYYNGTFLQALSDEKAGWVKVRVFGLEGYMMAKYLVLPEYLPIGASTVPAVRIANPSGTGLNLRETPSLSAPSLGLYKNGSIVRLFGVSETWCHVQTEDGKVGFMLRNRLSPRPVYDQSASPKRSAPEGSTFGKPGDPITDDFMPGGNG